MTETQVRQKLIDILESHAGTLHSVPWSSISLVDLHKLVTMITVDPQYYNDVLEQASEIIVAHNYKI